MNYNAQWLFPKVQNAYNVHFLPCILRIPSREGRSLRASESHWTSRCENMITSTIKLQDIHEIVLCKEAIMMAKLTLLSEAEVWMVWVLHTNTELNKGQWHNCNSNSCSIWKSTIKYHHILTRHQVYKTNSFLHAIIFSLKTIHDTINIQHKHIFGGHRKANTSSTCLLW